MGDQVLSRRSACLFLAVMILLASSALAQSSPFARQDPSKIVTATACGECHLSAFETWKGTPHATGFKTLHRKAAAEAIAEKMGFRLIKRDSLCLRCHYTPTEEDGQLRAASGVSCESCHGAAREWMDIHNNYGPGADRATETAAHRQQRIEQSRKLGMRRSSDLLGVVASCFECHTVPEEKLVNVGGHSTGSGTFELVGWYDKIRHNFLASSFAGGGDQNAALSPEHQRVMYVVGRALALEAAVRGLAQASGPGTYAQASSRRLRSALSEVRAVAGAAELPAADAMVAAVRAVRAVPGNGPELGKAADQIRQAAERFLADHDGSRLASLDGLLRGEYGAAEDQLAQEEGHGQASEDAESLASSASLAAAGAGEGTPGGGASKGGSRAPAQERGQEATREAASGGASPAAAAPRVVGQQKRKIRPASSHRTLGPSACSSCHGPQNAWWLGDPHFAAADPFFDRRPRNVQIARLYGLSSSALARGNQLCMDCHGSVVSGQEAREVQDGVGCESCHGAAADWLEPHKDETPGNPRPGYAKALRLGKNDLQDLALRAKVCTDCHYITEPRLVSAGHPTGQGFDYAGGMTKVKHWDKPSASGSRLASAFSAVLASRGAVPDVPVATLAAAAGGGSSGFSAGPTGTASSAGEASRDLPPGAPSTGDLSPGDLAGGRRSAASLAAGGLPPRPAAEAGAPVAASALSLPSSFPEIRPDLPLEEVLLILKQRLAQLYEKVGAKR